MLSNEELMYIDAGKWSWKDFGTWTGTTAAAGGGRLEEVCHAVVVASCGVVGGAIGSTAGPLGTASGAIAGSAFGEYIWQSVMED